MYGSEKVKQTTKFNPESGLPILRIFPYSMNFF